MVFILRYSANISNCKLGMCENQRILTKKTGINIIRYSQKNKAIESECLENHSPLNEVTVFSKALLLLGVKKK